MDSSTKQQMHTALQSIGLTSFRKFQEEAISAVLSGKDSLVIAATGACSVASEVQSLLHNNLPQHCGKHPAVILLCILAELLVQCEFVNMSCTVAS
jgi:shikimate kinase